MKKFGSFVISLLFLLVPSIFQPANAVVIKNGVKCVKSGASIKSGSKIYRCGKNPYFKPSNLTWTLRGCFTANSLLREAREQYEDWKDLAKLAGADGEKTLMELQASITALENTMKNEVCKRGA